MDELARFWVGGDVGMYPVALLAMVGVPLAGIAAVAGFTSPKPALSPPLAAAGCGILAGLFGAAGFAWGVSRMERALAMVNSRDAELIHHAGTSEARACLIFGVAVGAIVLALAVLSLGRTLALRRGQEPSSLATASTMVAAVGILLAGAGYAGAQLHQRSSEEALASYVLRDSEEDPAQAAAVRAEAEREAALAKGLSPLTGGGAVAVFAGVALLGLGLRRDG
ncbi:MAG: hypothetical protein ACYC8T_29135 [Myxococcaceae bacterium]